MWKRRAKNYVDICVDFQAGSHEADLGMLTFLEIIEGADEKSKLDEVLCGVKGHPGLSRNLVQAGNTDPGIVEGGLQVWKGRHVHQKRRVFICSRSVP